MKVATWNVNSLRARLERVLNWIDRNRPDVLCMQETKCADDAFPLEAFTVRGYHVARHGQATYNGVAIASRTPVTDVARGFVDDPVAGEARVLACTTGGLRIVDAYVVNGQAPGTDKFATKLAWLDAFTTFARGEATRGPTLILGDFNLCPDDRDVHDPARWRDAIFCTDEERGRFRRLLDVGFADLLRRHHDEVGIHTWWDYRMGAFVRGWGLRIDLALGTPDVAAACRDVTVDRDERKQGAWKSKPSDHAPVVVELDAAWPYATGRFKSHGPLAVA